jgi:hypothetical protein
VNARTPVVAVAALVGCLGAAAGPAYARFNIPTGASPSPLFGAQPFTQQMLLFEEFGTQPLPTIDCTGPACTSLPDPLDCQGPPNSTALDQFLSQPLHPRPTVEANTALPNPWSATISMCIGRQVTGVIEGRPPGENFAHQRYDDFPYQVYFQTAMAGSRVNGGIRDGLQMHRYSVGEFGPGGLYHNTAGIAGFDGTMRGLAIRFHPNMPVQDPKALWTFDGTLPPKLLMARYGTPILLRNYNALPIDPAANAGFGIHTIRACSQLT